MTGMTSARIADVTKLCVERGWLAYCPGAKGVQGTYFVCVPGGDDAAMGDAPLGQDHDIALTMGTERPAATQPTAHSPLPSSPSPADVATDSKYQPLLAQLKACGVRGAASCVSRALALIEIEHVSAVLAYHMARRIGDLFPYDPGLLVERLTNADYAALPPSEGWSEKLLSPAWVKAYARQLEVQRQQAELQKANQDQAKREAAETARRVRCEQLEMNFGPLLDQLAARDPGYLWAAVTRFNEDLASWGRNEKKNPSGLAAPLIRRRLLDMAERGELSLVTGQ